MLRVLSVQLLMESENNVSRGKPDCKPRNKKSPKKHPSFPFRADPCRSPFVSSSFSLPVFRQDHVSVPKKHENDLHFARAHDIVEA
jgi:hypothetical protein